MTLTGWHSKRSLPPWYLAYERSMVSFFRGGIPGRVEDGQVPHLSLGVANAAGLRKLRGARAWRILHSVLPNHGLNYGRIVAPMTKVDPAMRD